MNHIVVNVEKYLIKLKKKHCDECCQTYKIDHDHCCKCFDSWNPKTHYHCFRNEHCHGKTKINMDHCCECLNEWDSKYHKHCGQCHKNMSINKNHCCNCGIEFDNAMMEHCCGCKKIIPINTTHCKICHIDNPSNNHCCLCKSNDDCLCSEIKKKLCILAQHFLIKNNIGDFKLTPCLTTNCGSLQKFHKGLSLLGLSFEKILEQKIYYLAFHGTKTYTSTQDICCNGWNIKFRNGQAYGPGEYFSDSIHTAKSYAGYNGNVILSLLINVTVNKHIKIHRVSYTEKYYVVDNLDDQTFSLPVAIIKNHQDFNNKFDVCPRTINTTKIIRIIKNVKYRIDHRWVDYAPNELNQIINNAKDGLSHFTIQSTEGYSYYIDLINDTQMNTSSGKVRRLLIE